MEYICPECNTKINSIVRMCPNCGCPFDYIKKHQPNKVDIVFSASTPFEVLEEYANKGGDDAMYWLAFRFYYDEADDENCKMWLQRAIERGNADAKNRYEEWFGHDDQQAIANTINSGIVKDYPLKNLFAKYKSIVFFDLETTGLNPNAEKIIEIAAIKAVENNGFVSISDEMDEMISLPSGMRLTQRIIDITGIDDGILARAGKHESIVVKQWNKFIGDTKTLMVAYNAQFDMSFLHVLMSKYDGENLFFGFDWLDAMSIYKDRRDYPHKLGDAIQAYHLEDTVKNTHRAIDDTYSLYEVLKAMDSEYQDLEKYINLFGFNPRYGINGSPLSKINYVAQPYNNYKKLYQ